MPLQDTCKFVHRVNADDSYDSICLRCYRTVGRREVESSLNSDEESHKCSMDDLAHHLGSTGTSSSEF